MHRKISLLFVVVTVLSLVLSACPGDYCSSCGTQALATVEVTRVVAGTPQTIIITATLHLPNHQHTALPAGSVQINGAGATFPLPVYY